MNILLFPGITGTTLLNRSTGQYVWGPDYLQTGLNVATGSFEQLALDAFGQSVYPIAIGGIFSWYFQTFKTMYSAIRPDDQLVEVPYDWRLPWTTVAAQIAPIITAPCFWVCHSMGGLIALRVWQMLLDAGKSDLVRGIFLVGSPLTSATGNFAALQAIAGLGYFAFLLNLAAFSGDLIRALPTIGSIVPGGAARLKLFNTARTWISLLSMCPQSFLNHPSSYWAQWLKFGNPPTDANLTMASSERTTAFVEALFPVSRTFSLYGTGVPAPASCLFQANIDSKGSYTTTNDADGVVPTNEAYNEEVGLLVPGVDHMGLLEIQQLPKLVAAAVEKDWFRTQSPIAVATIQDPQTAIIPNTPLTPQSVGGYTWDVNRTFPLDP